MTARNSYTLQGVKYHEGHHHHLGEGRLRVAGVAVGLPHGRECSRAARRLYTLSVIASELELWNSGLCAFNVVVLRDQVTRRLSWRLQSA